MFVCNTRNSSKQQNSPSGSGKQHHAVPAKPHPRVIATLPSVPSGRDLARLEDPALIVKAREVNEFIRSAFPDSLEPPKAGDVACWALKGMFKPWELPGGGRNILSMLKDSFLYGQLNSDSPAVTYGDKLIGDRVVQLAVALGLDFEDTTTGGPADVIDAIRQCLRGKRVLVLGDDLGTTTEVLTRAFGVDAHALEYNPLKVYIGQAGLARRSTTDLKLVYGDLWDLCSRSSPLAQAYIPNSFHAVISWNVFNPGSGVESSSNSNSLNHFLANSDWLLATGGIQLHLRIQLDSSAEPSNSLTEQATTFYFGGRDAQIGRDATDVMPWLRFGPEHSIVMEASEKTELSAS